MSEAASLAHRKKQHYQTFALVVTVFVVLLVSAFAYSRHVTRVLRDDLLQRAELVAGAINLKDLAELRSSESDLGTQVYDRIKAQLIAVRAADPSCRFFYLMEERPSADGSATQVIFMADSEVPGSEDESPPGQIYEEIPEDYLPAFSQRKSQVVGPVEDRWGTWISALVPMDAAFTELDRRIVLGMDIDASNWKWLVLERMALPLGVILLFAILSLALIIRTQQLNLNRSNQIMNATFEQSLVGIVIVDAPSGELHFINSAAKEMTHWGKTQEYPSSLDSGFIRKQDLEQEKALDSLLAKAIDEEGSTENEEIQIPLLDGGVRHVLASSSPVRNFDGDILAGVLLFSDITELKRVQKEVLQTRDQFQSLVTNIPGATYRCLNDEHWTMLYMSRAVDPLTGYPASDFISNSVRSYASVILDEDTRYVDQMVATALKEKRSWDMEYRVLHKDGGVRWVHEKGGGVCKEDGTLIYLDGFIFDITDQKNIELELEQERQRLKDQTVLLKDLAARADQANHAKSAFLANMSHEIRTPLNGVLGMIDVLLDAEPVSERKEKLEIARNSGDALLNVVNDILDFSKLEAGKISLEELAFDLHKLIGDLTAPLRVQMEKKGLFFSVHVEPDLPKWVYGDPGRLRQVLNNLLGNALKFTESGEVTLKVFQQRGVDQEECLRIEVQDSGIGIPKNQQLKLFNRFEQVDASTTRKFGGTGLGLAISYQLVQLMGGHMSVESDVGAGACFAFQIPLKPAAAPSNVRRIAEEGEEALTLSKVLVAEDNRVNQKVILSMLHKLGIEADVVSNGQEAVTAFQANRYDLILMDIQMPEMDGLTATRNIRKLEDASGGSETGIPIIAMTAHAMQTHQDECYAAGMSDFVAKPVRLGTVKDALARWGKRG